MMAAIRYVRKFSSSFKKTKVFYFKGKASSVVSTPEGASYFLDGYTEKQCERFEERIIHYGGESSRVNSWSDITSYLNSTRNYNGCVLKISSLIFFCHGGPNSIYLSEKTGVFLKSADLPRLSSDAFIAHRFRGYGSAVHCTSWACQTANSSSTGSEEERVKASLAYEMSEVWGIEVWAACRRTVYSNAFGTKFGRLDNFIYRETVDGCLWENDGADGPVYVSDDHNHGWAPTPNGMFNSDAENDKISRKRWVT